MADADDPVPGFAVAALAPAVLVALYFGLWLGPVAAAFVFFIAFAVSGLHVVVLAAPLYMLIARHRPPGPALVLACAILIGALPIPLLSQGGASAFMIFGFEGLVGGMAFLAVTWRPAEAEGGE